MVAKRLESAVARESRRRELLLAQRLTLLGCGGMFPSHGMLLESEAKRSHGR